MNAGQPRLRHRGFFLHSDAGESEAAEQENPEGIAVRVGPSKRSRSRQMAGTNTRSGRSRTIQPHEDEGRPAIRSGSVTGSRQRAHLPR
jgi:hypothetical protein